MKQNADVGDNSTIHLQDVSQSKLVVDDGILTDTTPATATSTTAISHPASIVDGLSMTYPTQS